ncbi:MAG TPA: amidase, partial [Yaniella sp.]
AGYAPLATASDIAGSTRIPAGYNGVVGYKAPYGRVPGAGPMASDWYRGDGPMARTVADTALLYNVMAGAHHSDHSTIKSDVSISLSLDEGAEWLRGKRIGLTTNLGGYEVDQYAAGAIQETRKLLEAAGAHVVEVNPGWTSEHVRDVTMAHFGHLLADSMSDSISTFGGEVADYAYQFIHDAKQAAKKMTLWDSLRAEHTMQNELATLLADVEVLIAPVSAVSALEADASYLDGLTFENAQGQTVHLSHYWQAHMTVPFNINNRCPVLALPVPVQEAPIPVGIQIIGKAYDEQAVFNAAYAIEELSPFPGLAPLQLPATANL